MLRNDMRCLAAFLNGKGTNPNHTCREIDAGKPLVFKMVRNEDLPREFYRKVGQLVGSTGMVEGSKLTKLALVDFIKLFSNVKATKTHATGCDKYTHNP